MNRDEDEGISARALHRLGDLLAEPPWFVLRHLRSNRASKSLCGDKYGHHVTSTYAVTCDRCKAAHARRAARKAA